MPPNQQSETKEDTIEPRDYFGNQVHGGVVVNERVRAIFQAIDNDNTGVMASKCALKCLPERDYANIKALIDKVEIQYIEKLKYVQTPLERKEVLQSYSLDVAQILITYLDSIEQWWLKKSRVERHIMSIYDEPE